MAAVRIRTTINSYTLTLPELRPFIGRTVEIVIEEQPADATSTEFWAVASRLPTTEAEFAARQETFRRWRADPRFEAHWPVLDHVLAGDFEETRKWAEVLAATWNLTDYDDQAQVDQDACDLRDAEERLK